MVGRYLTAIKRIQESPFSAIYREFTANFATPTMHKYRISALSTQKSHKITGNLLEHIRENNFIIQANSTCYDIFYNGILARFCLIHVQIMVFLLTFLFGYVIMHTR